MKVFQSALLGVLLALSLTGAQEIKQPSVKECKTRWFDRDNPTGTGDYELLSQFWDENPHIICPQPLAIEVQTVDGIPASETGQKFAVNDATRGFTCVNAQQGKGNSCRDYRVRFTCPDAYCPTASSSPATLKPETLPPVQTFHPEPQPTSSAEGQKGETTPQVPLRPETTSPPAQTPHLGPEQTTSAEGQKGAPTPQTPLKQETTLPPAQTPHPGPEETTILKGGPTPQVPLRPETTLPPVQTPHPGAEETTILKGGPTPQVPLRPETTFPPVQTPHPGPEETTILKGGPTPQVPLRPETTFPPVQTPHPGPEETTILKGGPTPQVPLRPETTFPPVQTPHPGPEETTILKGGPTPQVPLRPETTFPPVQTPHPGPEETTILKGEPTPQVPLRPKTTFPPAQTPHFGPEQTTNAEDQKGETDGHFKEKEESECGEEIFESLAPNPDSKQIVTQSPQKVCNTRWFDEDDPSGTGDYELFFDIADKYPNDICSEPTAIEVQTLDGTPASETGLIFTINDAHTGFSCIHASQGKGKRCPDYQVRFTCPLSFCSGGKIPSTLGPEPVTFPAPTPTLKQVESSPEIPVKGEISPTQGPEPVTPPVTMPTLKQVESSTEVPVKGVEIPFIKVPEPVTSPAPTPTLEEIKGSPIIPVKGGLIQSTPALEPVTPPAPTPTLEQMQSSPTIPAKGDQNQPGEGLEPVTLLAPTVVSPEVKTGSQLQEQACKTNWFDRDNPSGTGDYELLSDIMDENEIDAICLDPIAIEVQTVDGIPASKTGQHFAVNDAAQGFACVNAHQGKGVTCSDYQVRFTCPAAFCGKGQPGVESTSAASAAPVPRTQKMNQFPSQGQDQSGLTPAASTPVDSVPVLTTTANIPADTVPVQTTHQRPAPVCKTKWLNRDNPTATGDYELIYYLKKDYPKAICNKPIAIEVQTVNGIPASQTGQIFSRNDAVNGFACINAQQGKRGVCHDYKVRFTCPDSFCSGNDQEGGKKESSST